LPSLFLLSVSLKLRLLYHQPQFIDSETLLHLLYRLLIITCLQNTNCFGEAFYRLKWFLKPNLHNYDAQ